MERKSLLLLGYGNMGSAFVEQIRDEFDMTVLSPNTKPEFDCVYVQDYSQLEGVFDVIVFGVSPRIIHQVLDQLGDKHHNEKTTFISLLAGKRVQLFKERLGPDTNISIVMCNLPVRDGKGILAVYPKTELPYLEKCGQVIYVEEEDDIDRLTVIVGAGSGFAYNLLEMYVAAALKMGLKTKVDMDKVVHSMFKGSLESYEKSTKTFKQMKDDVAHPGGVTETGLKDFKRAQPIFEDAFINAYNKTVEMGKNK